MYPSSLYFFFCFRPPSERLGDDVVSMANVGRLFVLRLLRHKIGTNINGQSQAIRTKKCARCLQFRPDSIQRLDFLRGKFHFL